MKVFKTTISFALLTAVILGLCACTSSYTDKSYDMAKQGKTTFDYGGFNASKDDIHGAVLSALSAKKWHITNSGNPIAAFIDGSQNAKVSISVYDNRISIDTRGSNIDGKPYVPLNYLKHLNAQIRKELSYANRAQSGKINIQITDTRTTVERTE